MTFEEEAAEAGFSTKQIVFMTEWLSQQGHEHAAEDIVDFDEAVEQVFEGDDIPDDDDEEEEEE